MVPGPYIMVAATFSSSYVSHQAQYIEGIHIEWLDQIHAQTHAQILPTQEIRNIERFLEIHGGREVIINLNTPLGDWLSSHGFGVNKYDYSSHGYLWVFDVAILRAILLWDGGFAGIGLQDFIRSIFSAPPATPSETGMTLAVSDLEGSHTHSK